MARIAAIRVDDKQDMVAGPTNSLHSHLAVIPAVVPFLNRWAGENTGRVVEAETSLPPGAQALGLRPTQRS